MHSVSLQTALDEGFLYKLQLKLPKDNPLQELDEAGYFDLTKSQCSDEESFLQEYMCVPADDEGAFLEFDLIDSCAYKAFENWQKDLINITNPLYIGVDIGRTSDLTVIWVVEKFADISFTRKIIELKNVSFSDQENILYPILSLENVRRCLIDSTGLGKQFAERAKERFGSYKIEEISFTNLIKSDLAYYLRHCFEDKKIRFPKNQNIISDLRNIRKTTTLSGNIRFEGERNSNGHSDRFWALALALYASKQSNESHISAIKADPLQNGRFI